MKKLPIIKGIAAGAAVTMATFLGFKLYGDVTSVLFGIACVCIGPIFGLIIHVLGYFLRSKKEEID